MNRRVGRMRQAAPRPRDLHLAWLGLVDTEGPFLALPPLLRVYPQGIPHLPDQSREHLAAVRSNFEAAWDAWDRRTDDAAALAAYHTARDAFVDVVLRDVLGWGDRWTPEDSVVAQAKATSPDHVVTVEPTGALRHGDTVGALVWVIDPVASLRDGLDDAWNANPVDRMEMMLRAAGVSVGVVTDGRWWALVSAPAETMAASGVADALTWGEAESTRDAFAELLSLRRLVGGAAGDRLPELFAESVLAAEEITDALGVQVRRAVELLVQAFAEGADDARRQGRPSPLPGADNGAGAGEAGEIYDAAVTVMMRVVFLLFAEERGLLPVGGLFEQGYSLTGTLDDLLRRSEDEGPEALDSTHLVWHRLLATSQALHRGASFEDLRLPAYGGSLFDPARFPFLTSTTDRGTLALTVSDRVMRQVLDAVQVARIRGQEARRLSFRDVDVEQIGYIYEGLLGYTSVYADRLTVGLVGTDGAEPEIPLDVLERLAAQTDEEDGGEKALARRIRAWVVEDQPAGKPATEARLAKGLAQESAANKLGAEQALRLVTADSAVRERLRPWLGVIRRDLRDRPLVVAEGGLLVVETPSRKHAGAHYTPSSLAKEVVEHALEPLVFHPGPHQSADRHAWRPVSPTEILDLKVADIACGSGAFLVAAARYLAERLVVAWRAHGQADGFTPHELETRALRDVVAHCLYGADINPMAVEMCKLSLWLVSLDRDLPFSFVDDKVLCGNALLGITEVRQLEALHIDPPRDVQAGMFQVAGSRVLRSLDVEARIRRAVGLREDLSSTVDERDPHRSAAAKQHQLDELRDLTRELRWVADGVIAAGLRLGGKPGRALTEAYDNLAVAVSLAIPDGGRESDPVMLDGIINKGLEPSVPTDHALWQPLHWPLEVPDVMTRGGFDAVIGNPPFLGGKKVSGAVGSNVREWLVNVLADGTKGNADQVAYFFLRALSLLKPDGVLGLIATNTVAQGDTREVGLDRMVGAGFTITRAVQSRSWPVSSANLEYAAVWGTPGTVADDAVRVASDVIVPAISSLLESEGRVIGPPMRLAENASRAFQGCIVLGDGFVVSPATAARWIEEDGSNAGVLFPYLNGDDMNGRADTSASRWVIDFTGCSEDAAKEFEEPFSRAYAEVREERASKSSAIRSAPWWVFWRSRKAMRSAIANLDAVLVIALVSKTVMPLRVSTGQVFSHALGVFATDSFADQAMLSSSLHQLWAITYGSTLETRVRYTPSDVFETFPRPEPTDDLDHWGKTLDEERREIMLRRQLGLTKLYNLVNDPDITDASDADVARLRDIHVELDRAVVAAYGWDDVPLDHGFHTYRQMERWTVSPAARVEILDRLLEENHRRAGIPTSSTSEDEGDD